MKPIDRHLLRWATDSYFALQQFGLDPEIAGRVIVRALTERLTNPNLTRKEPDMGRVSEMYGGNNLNAEDMTGDLTLTIRKVVEKTFDDGKTKLVLYFEEIKQALVANQTNALAIADIHGDEWEEGEWEGCVITLFRSKANLNGRSVPAIRVREPKPIKPAPVAKGGKKPVVTQQDVDDLDGGPDQDVPF